MLGPAGDFPIDGAPRVVPGSVQGQTSVDARTALAGRVGELALAANLTIGVAESLTGGMISSALAAAGWASQWFRGRWWPTPAR